MSQAYDAIYLSPHLDDAVLSCGGQIHRRTRNGERVLILTVFTQDLAPEITSEATKTVLDMMGLSAEEAMAVRRKEDAAACRMLGADLIHCPLPEGPGPARRPRAADLQRARSPFRCPGLRGLPLRQRSGRSPAGACPRPVRSSRPLLSAPTSTTKWCAKPRKTSSAAPWPITKTFPT